MPKRRELPAKLPQDLFAVLAVAATKPASVTRAAASIALSTASLSTVTGATAVSARDGAATAAALLAAAATRLAAQTAATASAGTAAASAPPAITTLPTTAATARRACRCDGRRTAKQPIQSVATHRRLGRRRDSAPPDGRLRGTLSWGSPPHASR